MKISDDEIDRLDREDSLASVRKLFHLRDGLIYLDGNSLGPAPKATLREMERVLRSEWADHLIASWNTAGWFRLTDRLGAKIARLIGAEADEVVVCDGTTINLFKALHAALALRPERGAIVAEAGGFPTDLYITEAVRDLRPGLDVRLEGRDGTTIEALIDSDVAVVLANHVDYRSGALRDMAALTQVAREAGALIVWDLCHSAGVLPIALEACGADFAVGCTYKYLNGGPGAPAFIYAARRHHGSIRHPLRGWWGHRDPFAFEQDFQAAPGIRAFLCGTQPILSLRALAPALEIFEQLELRQVRDKSRALTELFIALVEERCTGQGLSLASPREAECRGSQVAFRHAHAHAIVQALIARDVVGDFRAPDLLRFGFSPLYLRYRDVRDAAQSLAEVLESGAWRDPAYARVAAVT